MDNFVMDWEDTIENDGEGYVLLDEGDYDFTVTKFSREQWTGSAKIPACPMAVLTISISAPEGTANIRYQMHLYRTMEWKLAAFFRAIGQKKHGERMVMNWGAVEGAHGRCHVTQRRYTSISGEERTTNDIAYFYDAPGAVPSTSAAAPAQANSWKNRGF